MSAEPRHRNPSCLFVALCLVACGGDDEGGSGNGGDGTSGASFGPLPPGSAATSNALISTTGTVGGSTTGAPRSSSSGALPRASSTGAVDDSGGGAPEDIDVPIPDDATLIEVGEEAAFGEVRRLGINLGQHNQYGASTILANLVPNPGFEPGEFGTVFIVAPGATASRVQADEWRVTYNDPEAGIGHPPGFWDGARFELPQLGRAGAVEAFTHEDDRYTFALTGSGTAPEAGQLLFVHTEVPGYHGNAHGAFAADPSSSRPGSPGTQSLRLTPDEPIAWETVFDSHYRDADPTAIRLLVVEGAWHFEVWARGASDDATLTVSLERLGEHELFSRTFDLTSAWARYTHTFEVPAGLDAREPSDEANPVALTMGTGPGEVWVDDVVLRDADDDGDATFHHRLRERLAELRPGILRDWGEQIGSSFENQLAPAMGRRTHGYALGERTPRHYHYALPEFLALAETIGAEPWYVIPPTWSREELDDFVAYLAAPAGEHPMAARRADDGHPTPWTEAFARIHLELGNELWGSADPNGDPFAGATFGGGVTAAQVANARFEHLRQSPFFAPDRFDLVLGGQAAYPPRQEELAAHLSAADRIGLAPYYGSLEQSDTPAQRLGPLYAHPVESVRRGQMQDNRAIVRASGDLELAIYELNVHTLTTGPLEVRNDVLTSQAAAISLPLTMLTYLREWQLRPQVAFQTLQYSVSRGTDWLHAFGLLRDLRAGAQRRPTWLALQVANHGMLDQLLPTTHQGVTPMWTQPPVNGISLAYEIPEVQSFAFRDGREHGLVVFNLSLDQAHEVVFDVPGPVEPTTELLRLAADDPFADNEDDVEVTLAQERLEEGTDGLRSTLPPHSMTTLRWRSHPAAEPARF